MKMVEQADRLIQHAHVLLEYHEHIMPPIERTLAEDRMTLWVASFLVVHQIPDSEGAFPTEPKMSDMG